MPLNQIVNLDEDSLASFKKYISERQVSRLGVVGSSEITAETIEKSFKRFLSLLEKHFSIFPFLLGKRPASADFAMFGQLSQLVGFDPTSRKIAHEISPRTVAWVSLMEDLSGLEVSDQDWDNFVYNRKSLRGKHWELWQHISGCRQWIKVERDTATHEIFQTLKANEEISL